MKRTNLEFMLKVACAYDLALHEYVDWQHEYWLMRKSVEPMFMYFPVHSREWNQSRGLICGFLFRRLIMIFTLTQAHVDKSNMITEGLRCETCPVAICLQEEFPDSRVYCDYLYLQGERLTVPQKLYDVIDAFDHDKPVALPFEFEL